MVDATPWSQVVALIDTILPIGVLMMTTNGAPPDTFNGYITWALYSAADNKYLKMTTTGVVGSLQAQALV